MSAADALLSAFGVKPDSDPPKSRTGIWAGDLCFVPAGPNVNIYLTQRPGHVRRTSSTPSIRTCFDA